MPREPGIHGRIGLCGPVALAGFLYKDFALDGMAEAAWNYWYVCVPIVVVGAPLGSYVIKHMHRHSIAWILYISIFTQYTAAVLIIPHTTRLWMFNLGTFLVGSIVFAIIAKMGAVRTARTSPSILQQSL